MTMRRTAMRHARRAAGRCTHTKVQGPLVCKLCFVRYLERFAHRYAEEVLKEWTAGGSDYGVVETLKAVDKRGFKCATYTRER